MLVDLGSKPKSVEIYSERRKELIKRIQAQHPKKKGYVILFAGFESNLAPFKQESSFFYYTGISEPGAVLVVAMDGRTVLYIPNCGPVRSKWMYSPIALTQENAAVLGVDEVRVVGDACSGYTFSPFFEKNSYGHVIGLLETLMREDGVVFTLYPSDQHSYIEQRLVLMHLQTFVSGLKKHLIDIAELVADMRCRKDQFEIEDMYKAVQITTEAQQAAARAIAAGVTEAEVQASAEYIMTASQATMAFPSIVATGKQATILHYHAAKHTLKNNELVVVDIGARFDNYCADLTRTYPVSGTFTPRQKELYQLVLDTQEYIAALAKPGYWLNNKEHPDKSLNHLAKAFLKKHGYEQYFIHGIGHYLGLDVHDVGSYAQPLTEGNVITIEPGIYIPEEGIGIRIEDNYWIVKGGAVCLSEDLPKEINQIEALVKHTFDDDVDDDADEGERFGDDISMEMELELEEFTQDIEH